MSMSNPVDLPVTMAALDALAAAGGHPTAQHVRAIAAPVVAAELRRFAQDLRETVRELQDHKMLTLAQQEHLRAPHSPARRPGRRGRPAMSDLDERQCDACGSTDDCGHYWDGTLGDELDDEEELPMPDECPEGGRHWPATRQNDDGTPYRVCTECGELLDDE